MSQVNQSRSNNSFEGLKKHVEAQNTQNQEMLIEGRKKIDEAFSSREAEIKEVGQDLNAQQKREQKRLNDALFRQDAHLEERRRKEEIGSQNLARSSDRKQEHFAHSLQNRNLAHQENIQRKRDELAQKRMELERERQQRISQQSTSIFSSTQQQRNNMMQDSFSEYPTFQGTRGASSATRGASSVNQYNDHAASAEYTESDENICIIF